MTESDFIKLFPQLYHVTSIEAEAGIKRFGMLSVSALLDLFQIKGKERSAIESKHRPQIAKIQHSEKGIALIRDQKPMRESALLKCLIDITPAEWYRHLNNRVFFWVNRERVDRLVNAKAYRKQDQLILTFDTKKVIACCETKIELCPYNSGNTLYNPPARGIETFQAISVYDLEGWRRRRGAYKNAVVEFTVLERLEKANECLIRQEIIKR